MRIANVIAGCLMLAVLTNLANQAAAAERPTSEWVYPGADGKLVYKTLLAGDRIMDFSHAGYMGGGVALPTDVSVKRTIAQSGGEDDTKLIQSAIDEVAKLPIENGFRGAILLSPGVYPCGATINIAASGVVLRGSGSTGEKRSTIKMTGQPHLALAVRMPGGARNDEATPSTDADSKFETTIADAYVPCGATTFAVADASGFRVGDAIEVRRPVTEAWVHFMRMDDMTRNDKPQTWIKPGSTTRAERRIARVDGNRITLDVPLSDSFDAKFVNPPGAKVAKIAPPARVSQCGVEGLHIESPEQPISHSQPHFQAMRMNGEDCWARDLVIDETMNSVSTNGKRITLSRVSIVRKAKHQGASKPAELAPNGTQILIDRCSVTGDNVWYVATGGGHAGPIVVLNCAFRGDGRSEAHQRWSTGMLYDSCVAEGGGMEMRNRGSMGSGHGWAMGWGVVWNCVAKDYLVQNPPGAVNWLIGSIGTSKTAPRPFGDGPDLPGPTIDSHGTPVAPNSLYLAQLKERLGAQALRNIGYDSENIEPGR